MRCRIAVVVAVLLSTVAAAGTRELVEIRLTGRYFAEPATVRIIVAVEPDQQNRTLRIEADGDQLYRSTEMELEGERDKRLHMVEFKNLPAGEYQLRAEVLSTSGVLATATQDLMVFGSGGR